MMKDKLLARLRGAGAFVRLKIGCAWGRLFAWARCIFDLFSAAFYDLLGMLGYGLACWGIFLQFGKPAALMVGGGFLVALAIVSAWLERA